MRRSARAALVAGGACLVAYLVAVMQGNMVYEAHAVEAPYSPTPLEAGLIIAAPTLLLVAGALAVAARVRGSGQQP